MIASQAQMESGPVIDLSGGWLVVAVFVAVLLVCAWMSRPRKRDRDRDFARSHRVGR